MGSPYREMRRPQIFERGRHVRPQRLKVHALRSIKSYHRPQKGRINISNSHSRSKRTKDAPHTFIMGRLPPSPRRILITHQHMASFFALDGVVRNGREDLGTSHRAGFVACPAVAAEHDVCACFLVGYGFWAGDGQLVCLRGRIGLGRVSVRKRPWDAPLNCLHCDMRTYTCFPSSPASHRRDRWVDIPDTASTDPCNLFSPPSVPKNHLVSNKASVH